MTAARHEVAGGYGESAPADDARELIIAAEPEMNRCAGRPAIPYTRA